MGQQQAPKEGEVFDFPEGQVFDFPAEQVVETPEGRDPDEVTPEGMPVFKSEAVPNVAAEGAQAFVDFGKGFLENVNPIPALQALYGEMAATEATSDNPVTRVGEKVVGGVAGMAKKIGQAQGAEFDKAKAAYDSGRMSEAIGHTVAWLLPLIGPAAARAGETIGEGKIAEGLGQATGIMVPFGAMAGKGLTPARWARSFLVSRAGGRRQESISQPWRHQGCRRRTLQPSITRAARTFRSMPRRRLAVDTSDPRRTY
jgi:hypothetical protein